MYGIISQKKFGQLKILDFEFSTSVSSIRQKKAREK